MKLSVVTPSYNQSAFIAETIESVLAQNDPGVEHIIVDNCSTDETPQILSRYPHLKIICEKDRGQSDALNKGFKAATGDVVGWLNADDKYLPGCFDAVRKGFTETPHSDVIYGDYRFVDQEGQLIRLRKELDFDNFMLKYLHILYIPSTTSFFRRKIFEEGNFLDIDYHYAMDYEFFVRLAKQGYQFRHVPQIMADFRVYSESKSQRQTSLQKEEMEKALLEHDARLRNLDGLLRPMVRNSLMVFARLKRVGLKFLRGAYFG